MGILEYQLSRPFHRPPDVTVYHEAKIRRVSDISGPQGWSGAEALLTTLLADIMEILKYTIFQDPDIRRF